MGLLLLSLNSCKKDLHFAGAPTGRITLDSVYTLVFVADNKITSWVENYAYGFQYDQYGRVSRQFDPADTLVRENFIYDSRGNLETGDTYDDKVAFRRTNWIWMFIDRDFSVNRSRAHV